MDFAIAPLDAELATSPEWLGAALSRGLAQPVRITDRTILETIGPSALKIRIKVEIAGNRYGLPDQICLKGIFDPALSAWLKSGAQQAESLFYKSVAPRLSIRMPRSFYAGYDPVTGAGHVLMEDLVPQGVTFLSATSPFSVHQMHGSLDQLARLHGETWSADPNAEPWVRSKLRAFGEGAVMSAESLSVLMSDGRGAGLDANACNGGLIYAALNALADRERQLPLGFVHGDAHAGNVWQGPEGVGLVDWQVLQRGHWSLDVAYHMAAALEIEDRRDHERDLLAYYLERLAAHGGDELGFDAAFDQYRAAMPYGLFLWGVTRRVESDIVRRFVQRLGTAVSDHESFRALSI